MECRGLLDVPETYISYSETHDKWPEEVSRSSTAYLVGLNFNLRWFIPEWSDQDLPRALDAGKFLVVALSYIEELSWLFLKFKRLEHVMETMKDMCI